MKRVLWVVVVGGLAVAAAVVPALVGGTERVDAQCNAYFGSRNDGICIDGPSQPGPQFPPIGVGPTENGPGITTGPLLPGQTFGGYVPIG